MRFLRYAGPTKVVIGGKLLKTWSGRRDRTRDVQLGKTILDCKQTTTALWRSTQCIEIHGVSSGLVETQLDALIAFLKPECFSYRKTSKACRFEIARPTHAEPVRR
jgi:hypothetical protein